MWKRPVSRWQLRGEQLRGEMRISYNMGTPTNYVFMEALRMDGRPGKESQVKRVQVRGLSPG